MRALELDTQGILVSGGQKCCFAALPKPAHLSFTDSDSCGYPECL